MVNLYEIKEKVITSKKAVFTTKQLSNLISKSVQITNTYISRMVLKDLAIRKNGKVIFSNDDNVIGTQFIEPSYISLSSALFFHQIINQVPQVTSCVTTINSRNYKELGLKYHKITPKLFFGFKKYNLDFSFAYIADIEKAILDGIYLKIYTKEILIEYKKHINYKLLEKYSKKYPKNVKEAVLSVK